MSFQWLHRHELLRWAVTKEFRFVSWRNCVRPQICSTSSSKRNIARHTCVCVSKHYKGIFCKQGWSWSWRCEVMCTAFLEWELYYFIHLGNSYTAHKLRKNYSRNMMESLCLIQFEGLFNHLSSLLPFVQFCFARRQGTFTWKGSAVIRKCSYCAVIHTDSRTF